MNHFQNERNGGAGRANIVFVTETPKFDNEAKPAATNSVDWHSGGGVGTRIGEKTTMRTIIKTTSVSESIQTSMNAPQTTTMTRTTTTDGVTTWFTDILTSSSNSGVASSTLQLSSTIGTPTATSTSAPDGEGMPSSQLFTIIGGSIGGLLVLGVLLGAFNALLTREKSDRDRNNRVVNFGPTAGAGSHSQPHHEHENHPIGHRPQPPERSTSQTASHADVLHAESSNVGSPHALSPYAGYYHTVAPQSPVSQQYQSPHQVIAELPGDGYGQRMRDSNNSSV